MYTKAKGQKTVDLYIKYGKRTSAVIRELGLRYGEALVLTWDDIDWEGRTVTVDRPAVGIMGGGGKGTWKIASPNTASSVRRLSVGERLLSELHAEKERQEWNQKSTRICTQSFIWLAMS